MFAHRQHQLVLKRGRTDRQRERGEKVRDGRNEEKRAQAGSRGATVFIIINSSSRTNRTQNSLKKKVYKVHFSCQLSKAGRCKGHVHLFSVRHNTVEEVRGGINTLSPLRVAAATRGPFQSFSIVLCAVLGC